MGHLTETELTAFFRGELAPPLADAVAAHLDTCVDCLKTADELTAIPENIHTSVLIAVSTTRRSVAVGGQQLSGYADFVELGRGGSGVVYRANDLVANRPVAIKFLRAGAFATGAERDWLLAEASTAAKLDHANIVRIFALGGANAVPYYVMEYAAGGSLAQRLNGNPVEASTAAALIQKVATAVHSAHCAGIVHRDLKPGNILLADTSLDVPLVADFGMAKGAIVADLATPTQAVIGTPSYMAPEQALGNSSRAGPTADVYSLGAILFELLTGRPPFKGATPYETLLQVRSLDPVWPRRFRPDIPKPLEAICLKCLARDPAGRYQSAEHLADDLGRFLTGTRVLARHPGPVRQFIRWARANRAVAGLLTAFATFLAGAVITFAILWWQAESATKFARASRLESRQALARYAATSGRLFRGPDAVTPQERADLIRAVDDAEAVLTAKTGDPEEEAKSAYALLQLADSLHNLSEFEAARGPCQRAVEVLRQLSLAYPDQYRFELYYSQGCSQLSGTLWALDRHTESEEWLAEALRSGEQCLKRKPESVEMQGSLANYRVKLAGYLRVRGDIPGALTHLRDAAKVTRSLAEQYPDDPHRFQFASSCLRLMAAILYVTDRSSETYVELAHYNLTAFRRHFSNRERPDWHLALRSATDTVPATELLDCMGDFATADNLATAGISCAEELAGASGHIADLIVLARRLTIDGRRRWLRDRATASKQLRRAAEIYDNIRSRPNSPILEIDFQHAMLLATCPDPTVRDTARALEFARRTESHRLHSLVLGIALCEHGDYAAALEKLPTTSVLEQYQVMSSSYRAIALWHCGQQDKARETLTTVTATLRSSTNEAWLVRFEWARAWHEIMSGDPPRLWAK